MLRLSQLRLGLRNALAGTNLARWTACLADFLIPSLDSRDLSSKADGPRASLRPAPAGMGLCLAVGLWWGLGMQPQVFSTASLCFWSFLLPSSPLLLRQPKIKQKAFSTWQAQCKVLGRTRQSYINYPDFLKRRCCGG